MRDPAKSLYCAYMMTQQPAADPTIDDDATCADCLRPFDEHCPLCQECDCEGQECQDVVAP